MSFNHGLFDFNSDKFEHWAFNDDTFLNDLWDCDNPLDNSWNHNYFLDNLLYLNNSWAFHYLFHYSLLNAIHNSWNFSFNINRNWNLDSHLFHFLIRDDEWLLDDNGNCLVSFNLLWNFFFNYDQFFLIAVKWNNFLNDSFDINHNFLN